MPLHAKDVIYWPGLGKDLEHPVAACLTCQYIQTWQADAPLKWQPIAYRPLHTFGSEICEFDRSTYLLLTDMYAKMWFVHKCQWVLGMHKMCFVNKLPASGTGPMLSSQASGNCLSNMESLMSGTVTMDHNMFQLLLTTFQDHHGDLSMSLVVNTIQPQMNSWCQCVRSQKQCSPRQNIVVMTHSWPSWHSAQH